MLESGITSRDFEEAWGWIQMEPWYAEPVPYWGARVCQALENLRRGSAGVTEWASLIDMIPSEAEIMGVLQQAPGLERKMHGLGEHLEAAERANQGRHP